MFVTFALILLALANFGKSNDEFTAFKYFAEVLELDSVLTKISPAFNSLLQHRDKRGVVNDDIGPSVLKPIYSDFANESSANGTSKNHINSTFDCIQAVLDDLHANVKRNFPNYNESGGFNVAFKLKHDSFDDVSSHKWYSLFNVNSFEKFCRQYNSSRKIIDQCPKSTLLTIALDALAIVDFMCLKRYNDVVTNFPCLKQNDEGIYKPCKSKCGKFVTEGDNSTKSTHHDEGISKVLDSDCNYISCMMNCQIPIIESKCKKDAKNLVVDAVRTIFSSLKDLIVKKLGFDWPKSCDDLSDFHGPKRYH